MIQGFLLGFISCASLVGGLFFLRFWRETRDSFFLLFAASFLLEGANRISVLADVKPNEGSTVHYLVRIFSFLLILLAIYQKNYGRSR